ncbi:MAG: hypothetical protein ACI4MH_00490 [Candidatus Coproplasma sp.]
MPQRPENLKIENSRLKQLIAALLYLLITAALVGAAAWFITAFMQDYFEDVNLTTVCLVAIACGIFGAISLALSIVHFYKLKYDFIFLADDKGIYDYYSDIPLGFIPWETIDKINYSKLDLLDEKPTPNIIISFTQDKLAKRGKNLLQRTKIAQGFNALRIGFILAKPNREQIYCGLYQLFTYYKGGNKE